ncbi:hypothetical protein AGOR_G00212650 [Albula goreensis]|uniref:Small ribosomal subunit protein eS19 n=1 Tax=Albula goreensis TaxID=1534307 RepID=A0A8T3CRE3_9TELE|nr:hypothetical protein AGOR_G00212650 [Albula goreensis]
MSLTLNLILFVWVSRWDKFKPHAFSSRLKNTLHYKCTVKQSLARVDVITAVSKTGRKPRGFLFLLLSASKMPGVTVKDVNQQEFVRALAAFLKKSGKLKVPDWVDTVKLAKHKELAPCDENWFYTRAASTVRHLYLREERRLPRHFSCGSKNVARKVLQALEGLKMVEKDPNGGRRLTPQGQRDLDRIAGQVAAASKKS